MNRVWFNKCFKCSQNVAQNVLIKAMRFRVWSCNAPHAPDVEAIIKTWPILDARSWIEITNLARLQRFNHMGPKILRTALQSAAYLASLVFTRVGLLSLYLLVRNLHIFQLSIVKTLRTYWISCSCFTGGVASHPGRHLKISQDPSNTFVKSNWFLTEKLMNATLVTPTLDCNGEGRTATESSVF